MSCFSFARITYTCTSTTFGLLVFIPWGIPPLHNSDWSLSCDHGLD